MKEIKKVVIAFNEVQENAGPDELDIFDQVELAENCLKELGYETSRVTVNLDLSKFKKALLDEKPDLIFNLVESINNHGELLYFAPALYNNLRIPYTGVNTNGLFITTNKPLAKVWMQRNNIPTPESAELNETHKLKKDKTYLVKPKLEDGSLGFDDDLVFKGADVDKFDKIKTMSTNHFFIEEYVDGREFNISMLGGNKGPEILPIPEMNFHNFPEDKPKIMGFRAKWEEGSFEYENTSRSFIDETSENVLVDKLKKICVECWNAFELSGFVRVDFRVDKQGNPYVLEVNANPCITPGSGFYSACEKAGYTFTSAVVRIIEDATRNLR
ncbi:MAG: hypothetical protein A2W91_04505 [Bacteroidetes bacterium GWF2_38_335]|nr:MAG: hypothetical protein A2W91_04505 [Bacteroidetes bacterium GWF2_38_335]HBS88231.1 hypothetical protein [Bacteroidales bacterium]